MSINLVTGYRNEPHINPPDHAAMQAGICGPKTYILPTGSMMQAYARTANIIEVRDGDCMMQGVHFRIVPGTLEQVKISNGDPGMKRIDYIVAHYQKDPESAVETMEIRVKEGQSSSVNPLPPAVQTGVIRDGALEAEEILYKVTLNELAIQSIDRVVPVLAPLSDLIPQNLSHLVTPNWAWNLKFCSAVAQGQFVTLRFTFEVKELWSPGQKYEMGKANFPANLLPKEICHATGMATSYDGYNKGYATLLELQPDGKITVQSPTVLDSADRLVEGTIIYTI